MDSLLKIKKELSVLVILSMLLAMDHWQIKDDSLKYLLMAIAGSLTGVGGLQAYFNRGTQTTPQQ